MRWFWVVTLLALLATPATLLGQGNRDHIELGAFADYVRLHNANNENFVGVGGRLGFGLAPHVNVEADMAYDFGRNVTVISGSGASTTFFRGNLHLWHGIFGPTFWAGKKYARVFGEVKGGFLNFSTGPNTITGVVNTFGNSTNGVFYPGGGAELSLGPLGLRLDIGDLMYFNNGANHNLSIKFGPTFHF